MFLFPPTSQIVQIQNELYTNMLYQRKRNRSLFGTYKPDRGGKIPTGKEEDDVFQYDTESQEYFWQEFNYGEVERAESRRQQKIKATKIACVLELSEVRETQVEVERSRDVVGGSAIGGDVEGEAAYLDEFGRSRESEPKERPDLRSHESDSNRDEGS